MVGRRDQNLLVFIGWIGNSESLVDAGGQV